MTYKETLDWMFTQLPVYQQKGKVAYKGKLDNILKFTVQLGNPEIKFKSIHVAGTNGKGSSSHMLASILQEAGYKVGLYTSPHLKDFRERIRINGKTILKREVVNFINKNKDFLEENKLSFFEMTVGMAFDYFSKEKVDIAIIEVGLGGRLDSTNIITPEVSLITNIGMDHVDILGDSLDKVAAEKAGIIKQNVPVVISEYQKEIAKIFEDIAKSKHAKITFADQQVNKNHKTGLLGKYQNRNIRGVIAVINVLQGFKVKQKHIKKGLKRVAKNTGLLGRWQIIDDSPLIICDTAHNKEGLTLVLEQLQKLKFKNLRLILGFVKDKDLELILPLFPKRATYYFAKPNIIRGLDAHSLEKIARSYGLKGQVYASVSEALAIAIEHAHKKDLIFVGGSNFTVAEVV